MVHILLVFSDMATGNNLLGAILHPAGYKGTLVSSRDTAETFFAAQEPDLVIINDKLADGDGLDYVAYLVERRPYLPIILFPSNSADDLSGKALRAGCVDCLTPPLRTNQVLQSVRNALLRRQRLEDWSRQKIRKDTNSLKKRLDGLETLHRIGRKVTSYLDLDSVLSSVVEAAVELSEAEEGSLLLIDEASGDLYMRASRNFQEEFVRTFRLPVMDTLAGQVIKSGEPLLIHEKVSQKIKTSYLVNSLLYVPLIVNSRSIGVLGVDNRHNKHEFQELHVTLMSALADYAAIAIENARLYSNTELERSKLETILTKVEDGVIVIDNQQRILMVNRTAGAALDLHEEPLEGKPIKEVIRHLELKEILSCGMPVHSRRLEIVLEDGKVFNTQITPIPEVGVAVIMQDITHLKELDRIKSDFVNTVSHDLRSPLTAILGYVELIERVGQLTDQQREFVRRVQFSVNNITSLINDLLDLGRIEAGFDTLKEIVSFSAIIQYAIEGLHNRFDGKDLNLSVEIPENLPPVLGNPIRLRQMVANMLGNAIKYTPARGHISIRALSKDGQIILEMKDDGPGISPADLPHIFDKFYRGSNVALEIPGTGLGLSIVKSIVENHRGRIWVDSIPGKGACFTVVLPVAVSS